MVDLVTLQHAKWHLNITDNNRDFDIKSKIGQASALVMKHIKMAQVPDEWQSGSPVTYSIPADIQGAVLLVVGELHMNRESSTVDIAKALSMLDQYWDPALA